MPGYSQRDTSPHHFHRCRCDFASDKFEFDPNAHHPFLAPNPATAATTNVWETEKLAVNKELIFIHPISLPDHILMEQVFVKPAFRVSETCHKFVVPSMSYELFLRHSERTSFADPVKHVAVTAEDLFECAAIIGVPIRSLTNPSGIRVPAYHSPFPHDKTAGCINFCVL